ncbi:hypothetical protein [Paenibacillus sp. AD87]|uniref:hypothetical protein n=1 Tax=Paenibacillus sp. AD87 TaxID=1528787 RepID=UPI0007E48771|nr:hypothetical protein [Paenibacillus sp. AD87]OAX46136.1 hypothetical protein gpAD87_26940 [Paenibacillus sp. AD87]
MENQGIESHCADLMFFNQLWRKARELEENESANLKKIDQVYERIRALVRYLRLEPDTAQ